MTIPEDEKTAKGPDFDMGDMAFTGQPQEEQPAPAVEPIQPVAPDDDFADAIGDALADDIPVEPNTPAAAADEAPAPAAAPVKSEMAFDEDLDLMTEAEASGPAEPFFADSHWTNPQVAGKEDMVKERPKNFEPSAVLFMPSMEEEDLIRVVQALTPVVNTLSPASREWLTAVAGGQMYFANHGAFKNSLVDPKSLWRQVVDHDGTKIVAQVPAMATPAPGTILTGADAQIHMARTLKTYARLMFPLVHSGVWLVITVPGGDELHALEERMATAKFDLGWMGKGLVYSNTQVMQNIEFVNFVLERVQAASMDNASIANMKKFLRVTDINLMAAHMASAVYPSGFPLERPCSADPLKCHEVTRGVLRLSKIIWTNDNGLSVSQKKFLATRLGRKKSEEELKKYQEEFPGVTQRIVEIAPGMRVRFLPPTIEQYEQSGYAWIDSIERSANQMLTTLNKDELNEFMTDQYRMTTMRQYAHWVDAILYENDVVVTGREDINDSLARASTEEEVVKRFMAAVKAFIDDCAVSVVAINNYTCPNCGQSQTLAATNNPKLIPLDPIHTFFTLSGLKTQTTLLKNTER
jgi:hypothetical protein